MTHFEMMSSVTETVIAGDNIFVDDGFFSGAGMIENIAQTCAARIGYYNKFVLHNEVQVGFIGAIRSFTVDSPVPVGKTITTKVDVLEEVFGMTLATAVITCEGKVVARAEIKLALNTLS